MQTIAISGANGFVGKNLTTFFQTLGYKVLTITRTDLMEPKVLENKINQSEIVINLAGANIIHKWNEEYKKELYNSRIDTTQKIVNAINEQISKPKVFISTSSVGIYDNKKTYDENNAEFSDDFLSTLCQDWEEAAKKATCRVVIFRFGIVLGKDGGALQQMLTPFKLGLGGVIGNGKQAFSYIHMDDLKNAFKFAIERESLHDAYNLCATIPTTNMELTKALGKTLKRPTFFAIPQFIFKLMYAEGAKVLTDGQSVIPTRLEDAGFKFQFKTIDNTVEDLCKIG